MKSVMKEDFITKDEAERFLRENPSVVWIDLVLFDISGIARGKRIRRDDLKSVVSSGLMIPASVFIMDVRGNCVEATERLWETGDPDFACRILSGTLHASVSADDRHAQAVIAVDGREELDPRGVLIGAVDKLRAVGATPCIAVELEFYVTKPLNGGAFSLTTPPGISSDPEFSMTFQFDDLDALQPFVDDVYAQAAKQGLPIDAIMQESGPSQFEINLKHKADAVAAALDGLLLKRIIKAAARKHGFEANFMAKPHHDWPGSGLHVHASLLDQKGHNMFAGDPLSPMCRNAVGGLQQTMADFMCVWAQSANAYRRYVPRAYVPTVANWGFNNRNVALRIPNQTGAATRIEHRVSGADANPYLVAAGILAGMKHGIATAAEPGPMSTGEGNGVAAPALPLSWSAALQTFASSTIVRDAFGASFQRVFGLLKDSERQSFERIVTPLDHAWYAHVA